MTPWAPTYLFILLAPKRNEPFDHSLDAATAYVSCAPSAQSRTCQLLGVNKRALSKRKTLPELVRGRLAASPVLLLEELIVINLIK